MTRAEMAHLTANTDFWPANSLESWRDEPEKCFLVWLAQQRVLNIRHFRESSRETYAAMFSWWLANLSAKGLNLLEASTQDAANFFAACELKPVSRRRYLQLLDKVYQHLRAIGWPGSNPLTYELLSERALDIPLPAGLPDDELARLVALLAAVPGWRGDRDRCAAALLIGAGLRVNEFITLRVQDVSAQFGIVIKPQSVHREHASLILPDGPWRAWYQAWVGQRYSLAIPGEVLCPATRKGTAYSPSGLFLRVRAWLQQLDTELPHSGPNLLRNTFARQALLCGRYSPEQVQEFLGHVESRATSRHLAALETKSTPA